MRSVLTCMMLVPTLLSAAPSNDEALVSRITDLERRYALLEARVRGMEDRVHANKVSVLPESTAPTAAPASAPAPAPATMRANTGMIAVSLLEKNIDDNGSTAKTRSLNFMLMFTNNLGRELSAFVGDLRIKDASGALLFSVELPVELSIGAGKQASWLGAVDLSVTDPKQSKILSVDKSDLMVEFMPKEVTYADGGRDRMK